jgi:hypothetical protein
MVESRFCPSPSGFSKALVATVDAPAAGLQLRSDYQVHAIRPCTVRERLRGIPRGRTWD